MPTFYASKEQCFSLIGRSRLSLLQIGLIAIAFGTLLCSDCQLFFGLVLLNNLKSLAIGNGYFVFDWTLQWIVVLAPVADEPDGFGRLLHHEKVEAEWAKIHTIS